MHNVVPTFIGTKLDKECPISSFEFDDLDPRNRIVCRGKDGSSCNTPYKLDAFLEWCEKKKGGEKKNKFDCIICQEDLTDTLKEKGVDINKINTLAEKKEHYEVKLRERLDMFPVDLRPPVEEILRSEEPVKAQLTMLNRVLKNTEPLYTRDSQDTLRQLLTSYQGTNPVVQEL